MGTTITPEAFLAEAGLEDWQTDSAAAWLTVQTPDFAAGADFIGEIASIADEFDHHPDVDLRYSSVKIRTTSHDSGGLTRRDVALAQRLTQAAKARGLAVDREGRA